MSMKFLLSCTLFGKHYDSPYEEALLCPENLFRLETLPLQDQLGLVLSGSG